MALERDLDININLNRKNLPGDAAKVREEMKKLNRELLTDEEVASRARQKLIGDENRKRIDEATKAGDAEKRSFHETDQAIGTVVKSLGSFAAGFVGLNSASAVLGTIQSHFREVNRSIFESAQFVQKYREAIQELAALKGQMGNTTGAVGEDLAFRSRTLQSAGDARAFQMAALGVGGAAIGNQITQGEFTRAMELGGTFQAAEGGSADTHGTLIGLIPQLLGRKTTGEEVFRKEAQLYKIFQPGGPSFTSLSNQYSKSLAPLVGSKTLDAMQGAALLSAFSTTNKEGAGTEVEQFVRATLGGIDRTGKPRVAEGTPIGEYYKSLGINGDVIKGTKPTDLAFMIAGRIGNDLVSQEAAARARGEEFSRNVYLKHKGFVNQEDAAALAHYISLSESGQMKTFMDLAMPGAMPTLKEALAGPLKAQRTDPALMGRRADLASEAAQVARGAGQPEYITQLQRVAWANLAARGTVSGQYSEDVQNRWSLDPNEILFGARHKTELESQRLLVAEARRVGVRVPRITGDYYRGRRVGEHFLGNDALYDLSRQVIAAGGNPLPGLEGPVGAAQARLGASSSWESGEAVKVLKDIRDDGRKAVPLVPNVVPPAMGR